MKFSYFCIFNAGIVPYEIPTVGDPLPITLPPRRNAVKCQARADVGFIVDASGSLKHEFHKEKSFVKTLANRFGLGERASHAGIVLFSNFAEISVTFAEKNNDKEFNDAVDNLPILGATTRIDKALKVAYDELFQPKNGMRLDVKQVLFVLTDGGQTKADDSVSPAQAIYPFHESDIKVVVIGIGSRVNRTELRSMVKSEKDIYLAKHFDELISSKFVDEITAASCQKGKKKCLFVALFTSDFYIIIISIWIEPKFSNNLPI